MDAIKTTLGRPTLAAYLTPLPGISAEAVRFAIALGQVDAEFIEHRAARNPAPLVAAMTDVQRRVYSDAKMGAADVAEWAESLVEQNRTTVEATIAKQLSAVGCGSKLPAVAGQLLEAIRTAARASAESIINTFNYDLAVAILAVGQATPPANYRTYRSRLFGDTNNSIYPGFQNWSTSRAVTKMLQIAVNETSNAINAAINRFFTENDIEREFRILPLVASCPLCIKGVAGNPYKNLRAAQRSSPNGWPAHVNCPHFPEAIPAAPVKDCSKIWVGGG